MIKNKKINNEFKENMELIINQPIQGSDNSNCVNTARRFF